jgi:ABC-type microcin C transport system permease subunit YejE
VVSAPSSSRPGGVLAYILEDEDRTRRARSLLYPLAITAIIIIALMAYSPLVGVVVGALFGGPGIWVVIRRWRAIGGPGRMESDRRR